MQSVFERSRGFLESHNGLTVTGRKKSHGNLDLLLLHDVTAIVGLGGIVNVLIAFSFEQTLLETLFSEFTAGIDLPEADFEANLHEVAGEIVNIIVGHCTADFAVGQQTVTLSPPIVIREAKSIVRPKRAVFSCLNLTTNRGYVDVNFVGPSELFDGYLNERT